jgi:hypothetical protein
MMKNFAVCVFVLVFATFVQASEDCNSLRPDWKLPGTNCSIKPYYYEITVSNNHSLDCECTGDNYHDYDKSGSSTEYFTNYNCDCWEHIYDCNEFSYSCSTCSPLFPDPNCNDTHPSYYCDLICPYCSSIFDTCSVGGSWNDKTFTQNHSWTDSGTCQHDNDWTQNYSETLTIKAIFDKPSDPNCYRKPEVKYSKYDSRVLVRAKDGDTCCEVGGSQTLHIYCGRASHIKNVSYTQNDGQLYKVYLENATDVDCCTATNHSGASVKVTYRPRHGKVEFQKDLEETVEVSCDFYDDAGNSCGSGSASITFTLACPPPPGKG